MYTVPDFAEFHATIAQPIVNVDYGDPTGGFRTALAVEIPLMILALSTVVARVYSRLTIKRKLAADDILIMLGTVCVFRGCNWTLEKITNETQAAAFARTVISCMSADDNWGYDRKGYACHINSNWFKLTICS